MGKMQDAKWPHHLNKVTGIHLWDVYNAYVQSLIATNGLHLIDLFYLASRVCFCAKAQGSKYGSLCEMTSGRRTYGQELDCEIKTLNNVGSILIIIIYLIQLVPDSR